MIKWEPISTAMAHNETLGPKRYLRVFAGERECLMQRPTNPSNARVAVCRPFRREDCGQARHRAWLLA